MNELVLKQYLLGQLCEPELSAVEEQVFTESDWSELSLVVEGELIDNYLSGQLSPADQQDFSRYFLVTPDRQRRFQLAKELIAHAATAKPSSAASEPSWWSQFWLQLMRPLPLGAAALLLAGLVLGGIFYRRQLAPSAETPLASLPASAMPEKIQVSKSTPIRPTGKGQQSLELAASTVRSTSAPVQRAEIKLLPTTATLELKIIWPEKMNKTFQVQLVNQLTSEVLYQNTLALTTSKTASVLLVRVPTENLFAGHYRVEIIDAVTGDEWRPLFQITR